MRASTQALSLLAVPLNARTIQALSEEPLSLAELRTAIGFPAETTLRGHLRGLTELGIVARNQETAFPGAVGYALTESGLRLQEVAEDVDRWLQSSPAGPRPLGSAAAKSILKTFVEAWSYGMVRALSGQAMALTELSRLIVKLNYPSLERRFTALRLAGLIEPLPTEQRATPHRPTEWLRRAVGPITTASAWEREYLGASATPFGRLDVEAAFLLAIPLLQLPEGLTGLARLAVELPGGQGSRIAGVTARVEKGRVVTCVSCLEANPSDWAIGSVAAWFDAVAGGRLNGLEVGGNQTVAQAAIRALRHELLLNQPPNQRNTANA